MATSIADLMAQRAELERKINEMQHANRASTIEKIRSLMAESGVTMADLSRREPSAKVGRRSSGGTGVKLAAKFRDRTTGATWSGRGLQPKWLKAAIAAGAKLEDFAV